MDIFLSYARKDYDRAYQIKLGLERLGLSVFFDTEGLDGGDVFPDVLDNAVKTANVVVGVWSAYSLTRPWVKIECDIGRARGVLVPVQIEPIRDLDRPAAFWNMQHIDLSDYDGSDHNTGWQRLVRSLARTLNRPDLLPREEAPHSPPRSSTAATHSAVAEDASINTTAFATTATVPSARAPSRRSAAPALIVVLVIAFVGLGGWWAYSNGVLSQADETAANAPATAAETGDDEAAWRLAVRLKSLDAYNSYLQDFPSGRHAQEARAWVADADNTEWTAAKASGKSADLRRYLSQYPDGAHIDAAKSEIERLEKVRPEPAPSAAATRTASPPPSQGGEREDTLISGSPQKNAEAVVSQPAPSPQASSIAPAAKASSVQALKATLGTDNTITMQIDVARSAQQTWDRIGGFCDIGRWVAAGREIPCEITSGSGEVGTVRTVASRVKEVMVAKTPLSYGYHQPPASGVTYNRYHGFLEAIPVTATTTRLVYTLMYDDVGNPDQAAKTADTGRRRTQFEGALANMKALAEK